MLLALASTLVAGCGQGIPPAGNYATIAGRVTDSATGAGVAGAMVVVNVVLSATTDATGSYRIVSVPTGPWQYFVQGPSSYSSVATKDNPQPLMPGETHTLDIALTHR